LRPRPVGEQEGDEVGVFGQLEQPILEPEDRLLDAAGDGLGLALFGGLEGLGVPPALVAEDESEAVAALLDVGHAALRQMVSGEQPADQRRRINVRPTMFPFCSQSGPGNERRAYASAT
jgi:class 3 adenylate cyclase